MMILNARDLVGEGKKNTMLQPVIVRRGRQDRLVTAQDAQVTIVGTTSTRLIRCDVAGGE